MNRPEQQMQKAIVQHLRTRGAPGLVYWHTRNGVAGWGKAARIQGAIAKGMGARAGVSDLVFLHDGKFFALELKIEGGKPTEEQRAFIDDVNIAGGCATWAEGLDRALRILECWGLLKGQAAMRENAA